MKRIPVILLIVCMLGLCACSEYSFEVTEALKMAGENKQELVKVLVHYKHGNNIEKLKAAEFLIANLPYNFSYDTTNLHKYRTLYYASDSVKRLYENKDFDLNVHINPLWDSLRIHQDPYRDIYSKPVIEDIKVVTSDFLIGNIEQAYAAWKANPYSRDSVGFDDFCEYILPYRLIQGKAIENWRSFFAKHNKNHFSKSYPIPFTQACDSLFEQYKRYKFNYWLAEDLPVLKFADFMKIREGKCTVKTWFNTYVTNAEGIPMAIDFVPAWGQRENNHVWNAFIYGGRPVYYESYPEAKLNWNYNRAVYSNRYVDDEEGKLRLPKVYRYTYSTHIEGPVSDRKTPVENIPPLFRNIKKKDVSHEYFKPIDVTITLDTTLPEKNTKYAYLCVLSFGKTWAPVQWGKIKGNSVEFKGMGTDIVYQPAFYVNGNVIPFGAPFHLDHDGTQRKFIPGQTAQGVVVKRKYPAKKSLEMEASLIKGALIQASNRLDFRDAVTLKEIDFEPELRSYEIEINTTLKYRYYRLYSQNELTVHEIELFGEDSTGQEISLLGAFISDLPTVNSGFSSKVLDLGKVQHVSKFRFAPRNNLNHVLNGLNYELFYIDKGVFISLGRKQADASFELIYDNAPQDALLYLECLDGGIQQRIFEYSDGKQIWH